MPSIARHLGVDEFEEWELQNDIISDILCDVS